MANREITIGSIARIKVNNWATCATTKIYGDLDYCMDATHILITGVSPDKIRGQVIRIQDDEYMIRDPFRWHMSLGDVRPTRLAEQLTLKED